MKLNILETHDRLKYFVEDQSKTIWEGAEECLKKNPDSLALQDKSHYIYIFAHPRTHDDGVTKRLLWQPRLTRPIPQDNSYLFRAVSHTDLIEVCWLLPPIDLWEQYKKGNVCESNWTLWSIDQFLHNRKELSKPADEDWTDEQARNIWISILKEKKPTQGIVEAFSNSLEHETSQLDYFESVPA